MKSSTAFRVPRWFPLLALLLVLGGGLRLVNLTAPPLDFQPTRQLRNSLVARAIYYDALPGADPEKRLLADSFRRAVGQYEPPITESIVGYTFLLTGGESFAVPRIFGTLFWLLAGIALFDLARRISSPVAALVSLAYYLVLPFAVQASRSFQPDPLMTASFVVGIYFLYRWSEEQRWKWAILAAAFAGFAVLVKIVIVFLVIGAAVAIVLVTLRRRFWQSPQVWAMVAIMALPASSVLHPRSSRPLHRVLLLLDRGPDCIDHQSAFLRGLARIPGQPVRPDNPVPEPCRRTASRRPGHAGCCLASGSGTFSMA